MSNWPMSSSSCKCVMALSKYWNISRNSGSRFLSAEENNEIKYSKRHSTENQVSEQSLKWGGEIQLWKWMCQRRHG